jgi:hypothetical protein
MVTIEGHEVLVAAGDHKARIEGRTLFGGKNSAASQAFAASPNMIRSTLGA